MRIIEPHGIVLLTFLDARLLSWSHKLFALTDVIRRLGKLLLLAKHHAHQTVVIVPEDVVHVRVC
jgi:hypothetical protein